MASKVGVRTIEARAADYLFPLATGIAVVVAVSVLWSFVIPTVDDPFSVPWGCSEGLGTPPPRVKITLWEQWKKERQVRQLEEMYGRESGTRSAAY